MNIFEFHSNIIMDERTNQLVGVCPFCDKAGHFYSSMDWQYECKSCHKSGNQYTFIREIHELFFRGDAPELKALSEERSLSVRSLREMGVAYNHWNHTYILPTFKAGKIVNLYKYQDGKVMASPGLPQALMNWPETTEEEVWLIEGHWDRIAAQTIIGSRSITPVGVPGAGTFHPSWCNVFRDKDLVICYDNDESGREGTKKLVEKHIAVSPQKPRSIRYINWRDVPDKYDLRDVLKEYGPKTSYDIIEALIEPYPIPTGVHVVNTSVTDVIEDKSIDTFEKFMDVYRQVYLTTQDMELALLLVFSSIYSIKLEGEQIWIRLIGPPGCGKTSIAKAVSASDQVVLRSTFTGLFSGWQDGNEEDPSLVPIISGKTLIVKDADALLRQPNIERIMSELRDFYDKESSMSYKNRVSREYHNIRSTMVLCGTNSLRRSDNSFLGERFLDFEMRVLASEEDAIYDRVMAKALNIEENEERKVMAAAKGFIGHLMLRDNKVHVPKDIQHHIKSLATLVAKLRTTVERNRQGEITFDPHPELATRLIGQFVKVALCAPVVLNGDKACTRVMQLLNKLTLDILDPSSTRYKICESLALTPGQSRDDLVRRLKLAQTTCNRELEDLRKLQFIQHDIGQANSGNKVYVWSLMPNIETALRNLINQSEAQ